jgi:hypothetical protein
MARTGLRMMPTSPLPPLKFRTASFPRYGFKAGLSDKAFPAGWFAIALRALCCHRDSLLCVRDSALINTSVRAGQAALPQGPSLRSGLFCPGPSTLNLPHPPQSRAHPDFTASRLIPDAIAVHICICLGSPRLVLSFHCWSFATCRPLRPRGTFRLPIPSTSPKTLTFNSR